MGRANRERVLTLLAKVDERTIQRSIQHMQQLRTVVEATAQADANLSKVIQGESAAVGVHTERVRREVAELRQRVAISRLDVQAQQDRLEMVRKSIPAEERLNTERQQSIRNIQAETEALERDLALLRQGQSARRGGGGAGGGGGGGGGALGGSIFQRAGDLSTATSALSQLAPTGPLGDAVRLIADLTRALKIVPKLTGDVAEFGAATTAAGTATAGAAISVGTLVAAAAIAAPAVILVAIAVQRFTKELETNKQRLNAAIEGQVRYYELIATGTQEQIRAELEAAQARQNALNQTRTQLQDQLEALQSQATLMKPAEFAATQIAIATLKGQIEELGTESTTVTAEVDALTRALGSQAVQMRAQTQQAIEGAEQAAQQQMELSRLAATASSETVQQQLDDIALQRAALEQQISSLEAWAAKTEEGREALGRWNAELERLNATEQKLLRDVVPLVEARERESRALDRSRSLLERSAGLGKALEQFQADMKALDAKAAEQRKSLAEQTARRILEIERRRSEQEIDALQQFQRAEAQAAERLGQQIADIETKASDREADLVAKAHDRLESLERQHRDELARIQSDYDQAEFDATLNRDAVALANAQRERDKRLKDADKQLKDGLSQERKALQQQIADGRRADEQRIRDLRTAYLQEQRDRHMALQARINDLRMAAQVEIQQTRLQQAQQLTELSAQIQRERQLRMQRFTTELSDYGIHYSRLKTLTQSALNAIAQKWIDTFRKIARSTTTGGGTGGGGSDPYYPKFATGVRDFQGGMAWVGEQGRELAYLARGTNIMSNRELRDVLGGMRGGGRQVVIQPGAFGPGAFVFSSPATNYRDFRRDLERDFPTILAQGLARLAGIEG